MRGKSCLLVFGLILALVLPWGTRDLGAVWAASCDIVLDYGADPTFTISSTSAIQDAIDDAAIGLCDGGEVFVPNHEDGNEDGRSRY